MMNAMTQFFFKTFKTKDTVSDILCFNVDLIGKKVILAKSTLCYRFKYRLSIDLTTDHRCKMKFKSHCIVRNRYISFGNLLQANPYYFYKSH